MILKIKKNVQKFYLVDENKFLLILKVIKTRQELLKHCVNFYHLKCTGKFFLTKSNWHFGLISLVTVKLISIEGASTENVSIPKRTLAQLMRYRIGKHLVVKFTFIYYTRKWIFLFLFIFPILSIQYWCIYQLLKSFNDIFDKIFFRFPY